MTPRSRFVNAIRGLRAGLLTLALVFPCAALRTWADSGQHPIGSAVPSYGQRTDAFRRLLYEIKFQPLNTFADLQNNPRESVLIVLGDPSCLSKSNFPEGLRAFVEKGGAVLIATDKKTEGEAANNLTTVAGVTVTGEALACLRPDAEDLYNISPYCPFVQPIPDSAGSIGSTNVVGALAAAVGVGGRPELFRSPRPDQRHLRVATNAPSRLKKSGWWLLLPGGIQRLASLPQCEDEAKVRGPIHLLSFPMHPVNQPETQSRPLFAVGGTLGNGRVLVLADHSIFINRMILPRDTGNLQFAANCLHWLRGGASTPAEMLRATNSPQALPQMTGQRDKALFWDDGRIRSDFRVPMREVPLNAPLGSEPAIVVAIDRTVAKMEDRDAFNRNLLEELDNQNWSPRRLGRTAMYALTLTMLLFLGYVVVWRSRYRLDAAVPLLGYAVAGHEPKQSLFEQRRRSMLRAGNVWETAHQLARQYFEAAGVSLSGTSAPRVVLRGGWWQRWRVSRRVARLWKLARGDTPTRISPAALQRWLRELEELKTALTNGTIRLT